MNDLVIEPMRGEHVAAVLAIEEEIFDSPWTEGMFRQEVRDRFLSRPFVGKIDGAVVAYVIAWFLRQEVHLLNIAVAPAYQRHGVGRRMLGHLVEMASEGHRESISLEVRPSNARAIELYESFGFVTVGRRKQYYQNDREDALVMVLDLARGASRGEA